MTKSNGAIEKQTSGAYKALVRGPFVRMVGRPCRLPNTAARATRCVRSSRIERRPPRLDMTLYPYLPRAVVATTSAKAYLGLLTGAAS